MKDKLKLVLSKLDNIEYGFVDNNKNRYLDSLENWDSNFDKLYHLQSPEELIKTKCGVCWDQVELERYLLEKDNIKLKSYFIIAHNENQTKTHTFIVVESNNYYWVENSWEPYRGIHEYKSLTELLNDIKTKFEENIELKDKNYNLEIYKYDKPKYGINCIDFMKHCEKGKRINM